MPSYVIVHSSKKIGETTEAILCDPGVLGFPDRKTDVPVHVRRVSELVLAVDGELRQIISSVGGNGVATFLVNGSTRGLRNRERRVALARASELSEQLRRVVTALQPGDNAILEHLEAVAGWLCSERERATEGVPR